jgi:hypothetical protein
MNTGLVRLVMRTLQRRFREVTAWQGTEGDLLLLASRGPGLASSSELSARLARPAVRDDLVRIDVELVEGVLARQVMTSKQVAAFAGEGPSNSDDHNRLEYEAPVAFWAGTAATVPDFRARRASPAGLALEHHLAQEPLDATRARALYRSVAWPAADDHPLRRAAASVWRSLDPTNRQAALSLGDVAARQGDPATVFALLPEPRDRASALLELNATALEAQQRDGPWLVPRSFDPAPFAPFEGDDAKLDSAIARVCQRRRCGLAP